jgi:RimJ/RimL family protein N-acetyltransferase
MTDLELLHLQLASSFVLDGAGRLVCTNDPDRSPAAAFALAGCSAGNVCSFRNDVPDAHVREIERVVEREPPLSGFGQRPVYLDTYRKLLSGFAQNTDASTGLLWHLPKDIGYPSGAPIVRSGTEEGDALLRRMDREGVPPALLAMGFKDTDEFWAPWCALFCEGEIASLAFAARLGREAAHLGLVTVPAFRGRGFGAAATAAWAAHPALAGRTLFYGTAIGNLSSQRVTARLGLRSIGSTCTIM